MGQEALTGIDQLGRSHFEQPEPECHGISSGVFKHVKETPEQIHARLGHTQPVTHKLFTVVLWDFKGHTHEYEADTFEVAQMHAERFSGTFDARFDEDIKVECGVICKGYKLEECIATFKFGSNFNQWRYRK